MKYDTITVVGKQVFHVPAEVAGEISRLRDYVASFAHVGYVSSMDGCTSTKYSKQLPEGKHWLFISPPPKENLLRPAVTISGNATKEQIIRGAEIMRKLKEPKT